MIIFGVLLGLFNLFIFVGTISVWSNPKEYLDISKYTDNDLNTDNLLWFISALSTSVFIILTLCGVK